MTLVVWQQLLCMLVIGSDDVAMLRFLCYILSASTPYVGCMLSGISCTDPCIGQIKVIDLSFAVYSMPHV